MEGKTDLNKYCLVVGSTDVGRKRAANEDYMGSFDTCNGLISVVCDGMGGHVGGATASHIAVDTIHKFMEEQYYNDPREAIGMAIEMANKAILAEAAARPELCGMGSTCVLLLIREGKVYLGHVGDSRIYLIRTNTITQLTKDHSYVQMLVDCGQITKEQAEHHPRKNEITNALGIPDMTPATVMEEAITPDSGDCFLLCSDGLSGMVSDKEILSIVSKQKEMGTQERADYLVQRANEHGGLDNITVQLVEFASVPKSIEDTPIIKLIKQKKFWVTVILALLLIGGGVTTWLLLKEPDSPTTPEKSITTNAEQPDESDSKKEQNEKVIDSVSWASGFTFITIKYHKEYAEITLQQKKSERVGIDELNKIEVSGEFNIASLDCRNEGVEFGSQGSESSWIKFTKKKPVNPEIQFSLKAIDGTVYPFRVSVITGEENTPKPTTTTTANEASQGKGTEIIESVVSIVNEQREPTIYTVPFSTKKISTPFLQVYKDKYTLAEGGETKINLGMKLPEDVEAIQKPDYVDVQLDNNRILFSFNKEKDIPETFSITLKAVEEDNPTNPVNIIFNCKLK